MSFCTTVKNELAMVRPSGCCKPSFAYGFMLFGRSFSFKRIALQTANESVAKAYCDIINELYGILPDIKCGGSVRPTFVAEVKSEADRLKILASVDFGIGDYIDRSAFRRDCCTASFLRGVFLACGNVNDPEFEYRAEFNVKNEALADELCDLLSDNGIAMHRSKRANGVQLYTKDSTVVEDLLTLIGAGHKTLDIIDTKIMKEIKNNINRARNCDNANIEKTVEASIKQRKAIEYLKNTERLDSLPAELLEVANVRLNNPEATLKELCKLLSEPLTVSGISHRLKKIVEIYDEIKK